MKLVYADEPTSFLDHVYLGCTLRECKPNDINYCVDDVVRNVPISHLHHMRAASTCPFMLVSLHISHPLSSDLSCALVHSSDVCDYTRWLKT